MVENGNYYQPSHNVYRHTMIYQISKFLTAEKPLNPKAY